MSAATPSAMAVLPTPASPTSTGLFLVRRSSTFGGGGGRGLGRGSTLHQRCAWQAAQPLPSRRPLLPHLQRAVRLLLPTQQRVQPPRCRLCCEVPPVPQQRGASQGAGDGAGAAAATRANGAARVVGAAGGRRRRRKRDLAVPRPPRPLAWVGRSAASCWEAAPKAHRPLRHAGRPRSAPWCPPRTRPVAAASTGGSAECEQPVEPCASAPLCTQAQHGGHAPAPSAQPPPCLALQEGAQRDTVQQAMKVNAERAR